MKKIINFIEYLIGNGEEFDSEHRFLNIITLLSSISFSISLPCNLIFGLNWIITLISLISCVFCISIYILARFHKKVKYSFILFFIFTISALSIQWLLDGGIQGGIVYYFISLMVMALFIFEGKKRTLLAFIFILTVITLISVEYFYPQLITGYSTRKQLFMDHVSNFLTAVPFYIITIIFAKKIYKDEKMNTIKIIEQYRKNSELLKGEMNEKLKLLSLRERAIFKLIIEAKSNKEISEFLHISVPTVKTHINNIYKKLNVAKRIELSNSYQSIQNE